MRVASAYLAREVHFTARHWLRRAGRTVAEDEREFGDAARDHAHRYRCRVIVAGPLAAERGGIVNLGTLDAILREEIQERFEGRTINEAIPEFAAGRHLPTGEALAVYIWDRVAARLPPAVRLHVVRVQEGPHLYAEYRGEP